MVTLAAYLDEAASARFDPARRNCFFFAADWVAAVTGRDPAAGARDPAMVLSLYRAAERRALAEGAMERAGFVVTTTPKRGDVGLLDCPEGPTAGICLGRFWVVRSGIGLSIMSRPVLVAWSIR